MRLADQIKALPSIKDEHGDECVSREAVLGVVAGAQATFPPTVGEIIAEMYKRFGHLLGAREIDEFARDFGRPQP